MKKGLIITLVILLLVIGIGVVFVLMIGSMLEREPYVGNQSVLVLNISGEMPESAPQDFMTRLFEPPAMTFGDLTQDIRKAATDKRINGIWLKIDNPAFGWGKAQELQTTLAEFKKTGKFIIASTAACNELGYACALPADAIYLPEEGGFEFNGFVGQAMFIRDMLEKLNVEPEVERFGKYKSFGEMIDRKTMSDAQKEVMNSMLDETVKQFVGMVNHFRKLPEDRIRTLLLDEAPSTPQQALDAKLIDGIKYPDEVRELIKEKCGIAKNRKLRAVTGQTYRRISWESLGQAGGQRIALIYAVGAITRGQDSYSPIFGRSMGSDNLISAIRQVRDDDSIKAVILRVDSPGGDALASDLMWRELQLTDKKKPVIASMSDVAASGGYYIAMGCRKIVAEPGTVTGSIGVVSAMFNLKGLYDWMGINYETVSRGKWSEMMNETRPMTDAERQRFRESTLRFYEHFVGKAAKSRHKSFDDLQAVAQGRVWTGSQALENGLVDDLGGLEKAVAVARKEAGMAPDQKIQLVTYPQPKKLIDQILENLTESQARAVNPQLRRTLRYLGAYVLPGQSAILAVMPYQIEIH